MGAKRECFGEIFPKSMIKNINMTIQLGPILVLVREGMWRCKMQCWKAKIGANPTQSNLLKPILFVLSPFPASAGGTPRRRHLRLVYPNGPDIG
jgi:hypothetical protein